MRIEVLSEYPDVMLARAEHERRRGAVEHAAQAASLRAERARARSGRRWLAMLRLTGAVSRADRASRRQHVAAVLPAGREQAIRAGRNAERRVADELAQVLDDEWILLRGYRNARGEIDALLLGPQGLFAIEEKYRCVRVYVQGDDWVAQPVGRHGNPQGGWFPPHDGKGRSPGKQVMEPAAALSRWLSSNRRGTPIVPVVLLTHPGARIGELRQPTVRVGRSVGQLLALTGRSRYRLDARRRADIERLIRRDHQFHHQRAGLRDERAKAQPR